MKNKTLIILLILGACVNQTAQLPIIGDKYDGHIDQDSIQMILVQSSQFAQSVTSKINDIEYELGVLPTTNEVVYIGTHDPKFKTPEGFTLKSTIDTIQDSIGGEICFEPGWAWYINLPSGWMACFGSSADRVKPNSELTVSWFCKRDDIGEKTNIN